MAVCKYFASVNITLLLILSMYAISGIIRNSIEISSFEFKSSSWPLNICPLYVVLIIGQLILSAGTLFGIVGTIRKSAICILSGGFILLGVFVPFGIFGLMTIKQSTNDLRHIIFKGIRENNKSPQYYKWISDFQYENNCCGIYSYMDWNLFNMSDTLLSENSVPNTCCSHDVKIPSPDCGLHILKEAETIKHISAILFNEGCGTKFTAKYSKLLFELGLELVIIGIVCLCVAIFIYFGVSSTYSLVLAGRNRYDVRLVNNVDLAMRSRVRSQKPDGDNNYQNNFTSSPNAELRITKGTKKQLINSRNQHLSRKSSKKFGPSDRELQSHHHFQQRTDLQSSAPMSQATPIERDSAFKQMEMLHHPPSNAHSIQSTYPYSSISQNIHNTFSDSNANFSKSKLILASDNLEKHHSTLTYYSSLPQVQNAQSPPGSHHHQKLGKHAPQMTNTKYGATILPTHKIPPLMDENFNPILLASNITLNNDPCNNFSTLVPTTVGINNGTLLIMSSDEKLNDLEEQGSSTVTIIENISLANRVPSETNLATIPEESVMKMDKSSDNVFSVQTMSNISECKSEELLQNSCSIIDEAENYLEAHNNSTEDGQLPMNAVNE